MSDLTESHIAMARLTDALFCSELETGERPTGRQLAAAIRGSLKSRRNWDGCTRAVAAAFASNSTVAEERERWCREVAERVLAEADVRSAIDWLE